LSLGVDDLSHAIDYPQAGIASIVADRHVATLFEAVRDGAPVLAVLKPNREITIGDVLDLMKISPSSPLS
jgi:hypothetical protein